MTSTVVRSLAEVKARVMSRSASSQNVSNVLPSIRPSAPPMSHVRASSVYACSASTYVYLSSEKNTFTVTHTHTHTRTQATYVSECHESTLIHGYRFTHLPFLIFPSLPSRDPLDEAIALRYTRNHKPRR